MPDTVQVLKEARALIADPARWTTGCFAVDAAGEPIGPRDDGACRWCALGAIAAVMPEPIAISAAENVSPSSHGPLSSDALISPRPIRRV